MYRELNVVFCIARQQKNHLDGYHRYHSTEPQGFSVAFTDYHVVTTDTTNAAVKGLDSNWTPWRHSSGIQ